MNKRFIKQFVPRVLQIANAGNEFLLDAQVLWWLFFCCRCFGSLSATSFGFGAVGCSGAVVLSGGIAVLGILNSTNKGLDENLEEIVDLLRLGGGFGAVARESLRAYDNAYPLLTTDEATVAGYSLLLNFFRDGCRPLQDGIAILAGEQNFHFIADLIAKAIERVSKCLFLVLRGGVSLILLTTQDNCVSSCSRVAASAVGVSAVVVAEEKNNSADDCDDASHNHQKLSDFFHG